MSIWTFKKNLYELCVKCTISLFVNHFKTHLPFSMYNLSTKMISIRQNSIFIYKCSTFALYIVALKTNNFKKL
jgi:hypothetical protein